MKNKIALWAALLCNLLGIGFMAFPSAYVLCWASPDPNEILTSAYSYFNLTPYGYGNFFPFITVILAIAGAVFLLIFIVYGKCRKTAMIITGLGTATAIFSVMMSYSVTVAGVLIAGMLILSLALQLFISRRKELL